MSTYMVPQSCTPPRSKNEQLVARRPDEWRSGAMIQQKVFTCDFPAVQFGYGDEPRQMGGPECKDYHAIACDCLLLMVGLYSEGKLSPGDAFELQRHRGLPRVVKVGWFSVGRIGQSLQPVTKAVIRPPKDTRW